MFYGFRVTGARIPRVSEFQAPKAFNPKGQILNFKP